MRLSRFTLLSLGIALAGACGLPASALAVKPDVQAALTAPSSLAQGATGTLVVEMRIGRGWHVNSHTPKQTFLIPTNVTLKTSGGTVSEVRYPKHIEKRFAFSDEPLAVYEGAVRFQADIASPLGASGKISITGTLSYQACDEQACYPPATIDLQAAVDVTTPKAQAR